MKSKNIRLLFLAILFISIIIRLAVIYTAPQDINSDNGIMGLMAKHILEGEFPIFFYGQPYMGSLEAFILSLFFLVINISARTLSVAMTFITTIGIVSAYFLGKEIKGKTLGIYCMAIAAIPPAYIFWHGLSAFGGYPETLLFGNILLLLALKIIKVTDTHKKVRYYIFLGFIAGIAFWTHLVILYYLVPVAIFLIINEKKKFLFLKAPFATIPMFILGSLPFWIYNFTHNFRSFAMPASANILGGLGYFLQTMPPLLASDDLRNAFIYPVLIAIYITSLLSLIVFYGKTEARSGIRGFFYKVSRILKSPNILILLFFISVAFFMQETIWLLFAAQDI